MYSKLKEQLQTKRYPSHVVVYVRLISLTVGFSFSHVVVYVRLISLTVGFSLSHALTQSLAYCVSDFKSNICNQVVHSKAFSPPDCLVGPLVLPPDPVEFTTDAVGLVLTHRSVIMGCKST